MLNIILFSTILLTGSAQRNNAIEPQYPSYPAIDRCLYDEGVQVYPHEASCHSFYKCTNGTLTYETCENGLLFDGKGANIYNHCNYHVDVQCEGREFQLEPVNQGECEYAFGLYSAGPCETFFVKCTYAEPTYVPCQDSLVYDETIRGCNWPDLLEYCNPNEIVGFQCPARGPGAYDPHPRYSLGRCQPNYIVCVNDFPRKINCGDAKLFDEDALACHIDVIGC